MQVEQTWVMSNWTSLQHDNLVEEAGTSAEDTSDLAAQAWVRVSRNSHWGYQWRKMMSVQVQMMNLVLSEL